jgi:hypothetical protein
LSAGTATAQKLEIGGTVAAGCIGSEDSLCGRGTLPSVGAHASVWAGDPRGPVSYVVYVGLIQAVNAGIFEL